MFKRKFSIVRSCILFTAVLSCGGGGGGQPPPDGDQPPVGGPVYYVAPNGSDSNLGTSDRPWRTIQHAVNSVGPGSTIIVHGGDYREDVTISRSGTSGSPISLQIRGGTVTVRSVVFSQGVSHWKISGLTVRGYRIWGVDIRGGNTNIELEGLIVEGGESGIHLTVGESGRDPRFGQVSHIRIRNTRISGTVYTALDCTPGPCNDLVFENLEIYGAGLRNGGFGSDGIAVERGNNIRIENCRIYDNGGDGIDLNSRDRGGNAQGIVVRGNHIYRNRLNGLKLWAGGLVEYNAIWGQGINPLVVCAYNCSAVVRYNTVAYNMWAPEFGGRDYAATFGYPEPPQGPDRPLVRLRLHHNIFAFNTGPAHGAPTGIYLGPGVTLEEEHHNLFYSRENGEIFAAFLGDRYITRAEIANGTWARLSGHGQNDISVDPMFVSGWPNVDLRLREGSPARGRGAFP